jgi:murein DD-endopeptidase / murein LD-carboxypeptidase
MNLRSAFLLCVLLVVIASCRQRKHEAAAPKKKVSQNKAIPPKKTMPAPERDDWQHALGLNKKQVRDSRLYSFIGEWYGAPYKYGGCLKAGVDCSCFASLLSEKVYNRHLPRSANEMFLQAEKFGIDDAREGDLVFFKINSKQVTHVGVYLGKRMFVHSSTSQGVSVSSLDEAYYRKYFFCAGRMKGLAAGKPSR